jgi:hypothetical protein
MAGKADSGDAPEFDEVGTGALAGQGGVGEQEFERKQDGHHEPDKGVVGPSSCGWEWLHPCLRWYFAFDGISGKFGRLYNFGLSASPQKASKV